MRANQALRARGGLLYMFPAFFIAGRITQLFSFGVHAEPGNGPIGIGKVACHLVYFEDFAILTTG